MRLSYLFMCSLLLGCAASNEVIERTSTSLKYLTTCNSNSGLNCKYLYTKKEHLEYNNGPKGHMLFFNSELYPDSCNKMMKLNGNSYLNFIKFKGRTLEYIVRETGEILISNQNCTKQFDLFDRDSQYRSDYLVWVEADTSTGILKIQIAPDSIDYPYFSLYRLRTITYDLNAFCSKEELEEDIRFKQSMFEKLINVEITPNPYESEISFTAICSSWMCNRMCDVKVLTFYNEKGEELEKMNIEFNTEYKIMLDKIVKGSMAYYTITCSDYKISGKLLRSK